MFAFTTGAVMAQEKAKAEKEEWPKPGPNAKVLLENEKVRVMENTYKQARKMRCRSVGLRLYTC
jgi:hypothetical protein